MTSDRSHTLHLPAATQPARCDTNQSAGAVTTLIKGRDCRRTRNSCLLHAVNADNANLNRPTAMPLLSTIRRYTMLSNNRPRSTRSHTTPGPH